MSNGNSKFSIWDFITSLSTLCMAICTILIVVYGWKNIDIFTKDIELKARPYIDLLPKGSAGCWFYEWNDKIALEMYFELFNTYEAPTKVIKVKFHNVRIGPERWFLDKTISKSEILGFFQKVKDSEKVTFTYPEAGFHMSPKAPAQPCYFTVYLTRNQYDELYEDSRKNKLKRSLYVYYSVYYESFFNNLYETSYFYEVKLYPYDSDLSSGRKDFLMSRLFSIGFNIIWSESKELKSANTAEAYPDTKS